MKKEIIHYRLIFAANVKKQRSRLQISQEELSYLSGLHRTYISSIERGNRNVSIDAMQKISTALDVPLYKLLQE